MGMTFKAKHTYKGRSIGDADCLIYVEVLSRTAKTMKALVNGNLKTMRISIGYDGHEMVKPWGSYSMAPSITAGKIIGGL